MATATSSGGLLALRWTTGRRRRTAARPKRAACAWHGHKPLEGLDRFGDVNPHLVRGNLPVCCACAGQFLALATGWVLTALALLPSHLVCCPALPRKALGALPGRNTKGSLRRASGASSGLTSHGERWLALYCGAAAVLPYVIRYAELLRGAANACIAAALGEVPCPPCLSVRVGLEGTSSSWRGGGHPSARSGSLE
jgi:hypothetical protein